MEESALPRLAAKSLSLETEEREQLQQLLNRHSTPQQIALRGHIILLADAGQNHREIARQLKIRRKMARLWRERWLERRAVGMGVVERLQDAERSGAPARFELEQVLHLFKLACDDPADYDRPISQWTNRELADEMVRQQLVETISPRHVGRLLAEADLKPHQSGYWLNPPLDLQFDTKVNDICAAYLSAKERVTLGERTVCLDEMTGIQALERKAPDLPMRPGKIQRREARIHPSRYPNPHCQF